MRLISVVLSLFVFSSVVQGEAPSIFCNRLFVQVRKALVDPSVDDGLPTAYLRDRYGPDAYEKLSVKEFEDDVQRIYIALFDEELSQYYNWKWLSEKWGLGAEAAKILQAYYSLLVFDRHPVLKGKRASEVMALRSLLRHEFLKKNPEFRKKVDFYKERLGKNSVPEIAREMGVSEAQVYREIMEHGLSIVDAFKGDFGEGKNEAEEFIRHHVGIELHGESWSRIFEWEGQRVEESGILIFLKDQGFNRQEIAQLLNGAKVVVGDKNYKRTAQSVSQKLTDLGYVEPQNRGEGEVAIFPYGVLKKSGVLIPEKVLQFYYDHIELSLEEMAAKLEVQQGSLRSFLQRHHFLDVGADSVRSTKNSLNRLQVNDLASELPKLQRELKLIREREAFEKAILSHLAETGVFPADSSSFWRKRNSTVSRSKALGTGGQYAVNKAQSLTALNAGREKALENIRAAFENLKDKYTPTEQANIEKALSEEQEAARRDRDAQEFEKLSPLEQREAFEDAVLSHLAEMGVFPVPKSQFWRKKSPVSREKALGLGIYAPSETQTETQTLMPLNAGRKTALENILAQYERTKPKFNQTEQENIEKALSKEQEAERKERAAQEFEKLSIPDQREAFEKAILSHLAEIGVFPVSDSQFWNQESPVSRNKALGVGSRYAPGRVFASKALNAGRQSALDKIRTEYERKKNDFTEFEQKNIDKALSEEHEAIRRERKAQEFEKFSKDKQREAFEDAMLLYLAKTGVFPVAKSEFWTEDSPVSRLKALGTGQYAPGSPLASTALNTGIESAIKNMFRRYELTKIEFNQTEQENIEKVLKENLP